ncbi:MAG: hypothetical protein ACXVCP_09645 [Bdellovibrio sp.]
MVHFRIARQIGLTVLAVCSFTFSKKVHASTITAASCSYNDVSAAVASAGVGSTIKVPAGSCTWNNTLSIDKGVSLIGAGIGNTIITSNINDNLIYYAPADATINALIRVSGFTFDLNGVNPPLLFSGSSNSIIKQTRLRIDHNRFQNTPGLYFELRSIFGVVDSNEFAPTWYPIRFPVSAINDSGKSVWNNWEGVKFGSADNLYFEDNVFENLHDPSGVAVTDCQEGNRYAFRYNTINLSSGGWSLFDMHGNNGQQYSCMGGELYGNNMVGDAGGDFLDQRGGTVFVFNNNFTGGSWYHQIREEQDDSYTPVNYVGPNGPQVPQHVNGSYYWGNRMSFTGDTIPFNIGQMVGDIPKAGRDFFTNTTVPGIGCGPLASLPSICTTGQGFWATQQSCSDLTGMVGAHPANPISGKLYRCIATNTWDAGTAPLPYPHPLRAETLVVTTLAAPKNLRIF